MRDDLLPLPDIQMALRDPNADHAALRAIERDVRNELSLLRVDAQVALEHFDLHADLRPALVAYIVGTARLMGRSTARQLAVFLADRDDLFAELLFRSTGLSL